MRLSEANGLCVSDILLYTEIPHVNLMEHPWRSLKTPRNTRQIPLIDKSLWAAQRAISNTDNQFLFPRYCSDTKCKSDYASNTLNKWLFAYAPDGCVIHSFRHSLRDRLRGVQCPSDNDYYFYMRVPGVETSKLIFGLWVHPQDLAVLSH